MGRRDEFRNDETVRKNRRGLLKAFADLRKEGVIARANLACCQTCGGYEIAEMVSNMSEEKAKRVNGCVYWHGQDDDDIWERGQVYLAYGELETTVHGTVGLPTAEVGKMVVKALAAYGLKTIWDGNPTTRILVDLKVSASRDGDQVSADLAVLQQSGSRHAALKKRVLRISGWDGNAFAVMGNTKKGLQEAGVPKEKITQVIEDSTKGDYTFLLGTCMKALREAGYEVR